MIADVGDDSLLSCLVRQAQVKNPIWSVERKIDSSIVWSQVFEWTPSHW